MTRRRWIADEIAGDSAALVGDHAAHLVRVLRAKIGQEFDIAAGDVVRRGTITAISDHRVEFALGEEQTLMPAPQLTLALAIFKFDRMEWAIEKCSEIGVARILPIVARRTDPRLAAAAVKRRDRWERIALQASEQSRRSAAPEIAAPIRLRELGSTSTSTCKVVLAESDTNTRLRDALSSRPKDLILAIGPEGGWTADELRWFRESSWVAASLGDTILRAETAAIVAAAFALDVMW